VVTPTTVAVLTRSIALSVTDTLGAVSAAYKESNSIYAATPPVEHQPHAPSARQLAEGNVTLSWSGASSGAGNAISS
jgi:hypothetical protein